MAKTSFLQPHMDLLMDHLKYGRLLSGNVVVNGESHLFFSSYIKRGKSIANKVQLEAAIAYLKTHKDDLTGFYKAAGIGVVVTEADIKREVGCYELPCGE